MIQRKILSIVFIFTIFAFFLLGAINISPQTELFGVTKTIEEKPKYNFNDLINGEYQNLLGAYYSTEFPFYSYLVKAYDQLLYSVFKQSPNENIVRATNGNLFEMTYIKGYYGINVQNANEIKKHIDNIRIIQDYYDSKEQLFLYVITPSKVEVEENSVPNVFRKFSSNKKTTHELLVNELELQGINYIDAYETYIRINNQNDYKLFPSTGTHWNYYFAAEFINDLYNIIEELSDYNIPNYTYSVIEREEPFYFETDILRLVNVYKGIFDETYYDVKVNYEADNEYIPTLIRFTTSFSGQLDYLIDYDNLFENQKYYRYLKGEFIPAGGRFDYINIANNDVEAIDWSTVLNEGELILFEHTAAKIPKAHLRIAEAFSEKIQNAYANGLNNNINTLTKEQNITCDNTIDFVVDNKTLSVSANQIVEIPIVIINHTDKVLSSTTNNPFRLSYHVKTSDYQMVTWDGERTDLHEPIAPNSMSTIKLRVNSPQKPGTYILEITGLYEGYSWIEKLYENFPIKISMEVE